MRRLALYAAYGSLIVFLAWRAYPEFWVVATSGRLRQPQEFIGPAFHHEFATRLSPLTSVYRGDIQRTGADLKQTLPFKLKKSWSFRPLNVGIHGASKASPAIDDSGIYLGTDSGYFFSLDFHGHLRWQLYLPDSLRGIHGTAALDSDSVYIGAYNGVMYSLNKNTGAVRWSRKLGDAIGSSPALYEKDLLVSVETSHPNGYLVRLNRQTGEIVWVSRWLGEQSHSSPSISAEHNLVFIGSNRAEFLAFSLATGDLKWSRQLLGEMKSTPVTIDHHVYFTSWGQKLLALNAQSGKLEWQVPLKSVSQSSATYVPYRDLIVAGDHSGYLTAVKRSTGQKVWEKSRPISRFITSPLVSQNPEGRIVLWTLCETKKLCALDAKTGQALSEILLPSTLTSVPVIYKNHLYLALDGLEGGLQVYQGQSQ